MEGVVVRGDSGIGGVLEGGWYVRGRAMQGGIVHEMIMM